MLLVAVLAAAGSYAAISLRPTSVDDPPRVLVPAPDNPTLNIGANGVDLGRITAAIETWRDNLERDPADFISAVNLSSLFLERGHLTSKAADLDAALAAVEQAVTTDPSLPAPRLHRIQVLLASHEFASAEAAAIEFLADQPDEPAALAALGDARMELGDLAGARAAWADAGQETTAPMIARRARLAMLSGSLAEAGRLADQALALAVADPEASGDPPFYHLLAGSIAFQSGDYERSLAESEAALAAEPGSPGALVAIARAQAALGDPRAAIASYEHAAVTRPDVVTLAALGDLLAVVGRTAESEARYAEVRAILEDPGQARLEGRALALFLTDHGEQADRAVELATADVAARQDVHAWDAYAWALYAAGRYEDAEDAMRHALAEETEESLLEYHAGMIAAKLGRTDEARRLLGSALDRNPAFDPIGAARAREALADLGGRP
jgi:tetratricopeptide (TPR) repeat protein